MKYVIEPEKCTGCTACKNICPQKCINMETNSEGFLYPVIDESKCINCNLCKKTCPVLNYKDENKIAKTFVAYNKNDEERITSSSGGIFQLLAKSIIEQGGIVCGATLEGMKVTHKLINNVVELECLKGSKYVQSDLNDTFCRIKEFLKDNKVVLFVGTTCQVAGLLSYLKKDYENLYTCDLLCHGVPSPKVFDEYCKLLEKKYDSKIKKYDFRNKDNGWENYSIKVEFENGKIYQKRFSEDLYMRGFLQNLYLRESCEDCNFKTKSHVSDITLGDYWGSNKYHKDMNDKKGLSVLFVNSKKGEKILDNIRNELEVRECTFEEAICNNQILFSSVRVSKNRTQFFNDLNGNGLEYAMNKNIIKDPLWKKTIKYILKITGLRK